MLIALGLVVRVTSKVVESYKGDKGQYSTRENLVTFISREAIPATSIVI